MDECISNSVEFPLLIKDILYLLSPQCIFFNTNIFPLEGILNLARGLQHISGGISIHYESAVSGKSIWACLFVRLSVSPSVYLCERLFVATQTSFSVLERSL